MTQPTIDNRIATLDDLYGRITRTAEAIGGRASRNRSCLAVPLQMVAEPRTEDVPALQVEMPDSFQVNFAPLYPLSAGNALSVQARRTHHGARKNDWFFNFGPDGWRRTQVLLSEEEIRACLTPEGPRPFEF